MMDDKTALAASRRILSVDGAGLENTDPELAVLLARFVLEEVPNEPAAALDDTTRMLAVMAALIGVQGLDAYGNAVRQALDVGVSPLAAREVVYQAVAYMGLGRALPYLHRFNAVVQSAGVTLPLPAAGTVCHEERLAAGERTQMALFGPHMQGFADSGPADSRHINHWLVDNCFADYYTREGLTHRQREMITFCFLAGQGGCEPQLTSHASANLGLGNDEGFMLAVLSQCLPYIGYPRSLNALRCLREAAAAQK